MRLPALLTLLSVSLAAPNPMPQFGLGKTRPSTVSSGSTRAIAVTTVEQAGVPAESPWVYEVSSAPAATVTGSDEAGFPAEGPWLYGEGPREEPGQPILTVLDGATRTWYPVPEATTPTHLAPISLPFNGFNTILPGNIPEVQVSAVGPGVHGRAPQNNNEPIRTVMDGATAIWYPAGYSFASESRGATITATQEVPVVVGGVDETTTTIPSDQAEPTEPPATAARDESGGNPIAPSHDDDYTTPRGPGYCGVSSFENQTTNASPRKEDCLQIVRNIAGGGGRWDIDLFLAEQRRILRAGTCRFGVKGYRDSPIPELKAYINWFDVTDLILDSVELFGENGRVGAKGLMECRDYYGHLRPVLWGIY